MTGILEGIRVLDFGMAAVGPLAATYLGVLGADVIKIESPRGDVVRSPAGTTQQGMGTTFIGNNYGKRGIMLDLKDERDHEIAARMIASADVVLDNFRSADIMARLGFGYEVMQRLNPRIIYLQASAYGSRGPMNGMLSNEWFTQASSGYTCLNGQPGGRAEFLRGSAHLDWNGAMLNCLGLLAALYHRERTGRGMFLQTSQFQSTIYAGLSRWAEYFATGQVPPRLGSGRSNIVPDQAFETALGYVSVSALHDGLWRRLCQAIELPELADDPRFLTNRLRVQHRDELVPLLQERFLQRCASEWLAILRAHRVPCGEYFDGRPRSKIVLDHPQVKANGMMATIETPWGPGNYGTGHWRFGKNTTHVPRPAPRLDQHRAEILAEIGYDAPAEVRA